MLRVPRELRTVLVHFSQGIQDPSLFSWNKQGHSVDSWLAGSGFLPKEPNTTAFVPLNSPEFKDTA